MVEKSKYNLNYSSMRRCVFEECYKRAIFAFNVNQEAIYCIEHRESDTIPVCKVYCKYLSCKKRAKQEENNSLCEKHSEKQQEKVEIDSLKKIRCKHSPWCRRIAKYARNMELTPLWCEDHKEPGDICVDKTKCKNKFCNQEATHYYNGKKMLYCINHFNKKEKFDNKIKKVLQKDTQKVPPTVALKELFYV